jgi:hypothetical protein
VFDLIGATYSIAASGKPVENWAPNFLFIFIAFGSYIYYHKIVKAEALSKTIEKQPAGTSNPNLTTSYI